jgi:hypothetical protein
MAKSQPAFCPPPRRRRRIRLIAGFPSVLKAMTIIRSETVCTENLICLDYGTESPNFGLPS